MQNKYIQFGLRLDLLLKDKAERLKVKKITQKELAKVLGVDQSFISQMIKGQRLPSTDTAIELANYLDCCLDYLLRGIGSKRPVESMNIYDLIDASSLKSTQKDIFKAFMRSISQN